MTERNPERTRAALLDAAQELILDRGFAGASVDAIVERAGMTKGAFFHHFDSKKALARALMERYARYDCEHMERTIERAESLSRDPLQRVLIAVGLLHEEAAALTEPFEGCLFASYGYQLELFDDEIMEVARDALRRWRTRIAAMLEAAAERHPPVRPIDPEKLADMLSVIFEGAFILSKTLGDPDIVADQVARYREHLELLFGVEA